MKIFLARISKEDMNKEERKNFASLDDYLKYKWQQQENVVKEYFKIEKFDKSFYDSGSAYKLEAFNKRKEFHAILDYMFDYSKVTIKDIFWLNIENKEEIELYVYDYNRISRVMEYNLLFSFLCDMYKIKIYSFNQPQILMQGEEDVVKKGTRYIMLLVTAMNSEQYSESTSKNTKKAAQRKDYVTLSYKNKVWGKGFKTINGEKLSLKKTIDLKNYIIEQIEYYEQKHQKQYYSKIIDGVQNLFSVEISKPIITRLRKVI